MSFARGQLYLMHPWALVMQTVMGKANECKELKITELKTKTKNLKILKILKTSILEIMLLILECTRNEAEVTVKLSNRGKEQSQSLAPTHSGVRIDDYS